jgi:hypothetical protein
MVTDIKLPANAALLVPHRPPLLLVDRLLEFTGKAGVVESVIAPIIFFLLMKAPEGDCHGRAAGPVCCCCKGLQ